MMMMDASKVRYEMETKKGKRDMMMMMMDAITKYKTEAICIKALVGE